ncbi:MAG TPA: DUF2127 domain-containing protein [Pyrinomonadaceae bacterium]|nr:DUF2127 domain-containing protein [Pyrinomonadaceae bacterium]
MNRALHTRPLGITALIIFFLVGGLISFLAVLSLLFPSTFFELVWRVNPRGHEGLLRIGFWGVVLLFAASASCAVATIGLWRRTRWGHILAITLIGVHLFSDLISTVLRIEPRAIVGVPIALAILLYLRSRRVQDYFAQYMSNRIE